MSAVDQLLAILFLVVWLALWWLAVRVVCGRRVDPVESALVEFVLVAFFAFGVPMIIADWIATHESHFTAWVLPAYGAIPVVIDTGWYVRRAYYRLANR